MPAPVVTAVRGPLSWNIFDPTTDAFVVKGGFRILATLSSSKEGADWVLSYYTLLIDPSIVDDEFESARLNTSTVVIPYALATDLADALDIAKAFIDVVHDRLLP